MWSEKARFRFEIDNFSEKEASIYSPTFVSGGCEWRLQVYPKGRPSAGDHLSLFLHVANPNSLPTGWKKRVQYYFVVLNQSDKELYRSKPKAGEESTLFCAESTSWGFKQTLHLCKLQEVGSLENDKLIIDVYINVVEALDGEGEDVSKKIESVEINGFQILASQVTSVRKLLAEHPDIAEDFKPNNKAVKTAYMNVLLKLVKKLEKSPESLSETKLSKASSKLSELMDVGFKLGWLKSKLDEISLEKKKLDDESRVQKIEERIKNLEDLELGSKLESMKTKIVEVTLERMKADSDGRMFQQLDKRLKNLEVNEWGSKVHDLKTELDDLTTELDELTTELDAEKTKEKSLAHQLEERLKNLEGMEIGSKLGSLKTKIDEVTLERNYADGSLFQQLDKRVKNLELNETGSKVDDLKTELDDLVKENFNNFEFLKTKLDEVTLLRNDDFIWGEQLEERVKNLEADDSDDDDDDDDDDDESLVEELEQRVKNLEGMEIGSKLGSLKTKIDEITLERKNADGFLFQQLDKRVKNLELNETGSKVDDLKTKLDEVTLLRNADFVKAEKLEERVQNLEDEDYDDDDDDDDDDESLVEELEQRVKNLEAMDLEYKLDSLNRKVEEVSLKVNKSEYHYESRFKQLEESIKKLGMMELGFKVDCLNTKLEEASLEKKRSDDAEESRIQQLEDDVHDIRLMFSYLKDEVNKKKDKSSADGFLLID